MAAMLTDQGRVMEISLLVFVLKPDVISNRRTIVPAQISIPSEISTVVGQRQLFLM